MTGKYFKDNKNDMPNRCVWVTTVKNSDHNNVSWILRLGPFVTGLFSSCREPVDEVLQMPPSLLTCGGCQQSIGDRFFLKAIEQYWHEDCLSCDLCGCRLGEVGRRLYYKLGRKLCRRDYLRCGWCRGGKSGAFIHKIPEFNCGPTCWFCLLHSGFSVRTASAPPVRRGSGHLRWPCVCGTRFTIWSASSAPPARSTSVWATATFSSTRTSCASRTSSSGPSSMAAAWCRIFEIKGLVNSWLCDALHTES